MYLHFGSSLLTNCGPARDGVGVAGEFVAAGDAGRPSLRDGKLVTAQRFDFEIVQELLNVVEVVVVAVARCSVAAALVGNLGQC